MARLSRCLWVGPLAESQCHLRDPCRGTEIDTDLFGWCGAPALGGGGTLGGGPMASNGGWAGISALLFFCFLAFVCFPLPLGCTSASRADGGMVMSFDAR